MILAVGADCRVVKNERRVDDGKGLVCRKGLVGRYYRISMTTLHGLVLLHVRNVFLWLLLQAISVCCSP